MDALVTVCSWNTNVIMVWAWMLWSPTVCSWKRNFIIVWAWMIWSPYALGTRTEFWFGHGCFGPRMLFEHERYYGLGMDALVTVCSWNTNGIMVLAWMLRSSYAFGTRTRKIRQNVGPIAKTSIVTLRTLGLVNGGEPAKPSHPVARLNLKPQIWVQGLGCRV